MNLSLRHPVWLVMRLAIVSASLFLLSTCKTLAPPPSVDEFARTADDVRVALRIPGLSVAIVRGGEVLLARGFGESDVEAKTPASAETLYPIGSITKTFTSTLMLQLVERGRLDLDKDVAQYVDWEVSPDIRIRHVLSHTSEWGPGERFVYSSRFNWLDNVVKAATHESFRKLLQDQVLTPAGLAHTFGGEETEGYADTLAELAKPYRLDERGRIARSDYPPMALHSSSGLSSTVIDLARYSAALDEGTLLTPASLEAAWTPSREGLPYGLGWFTQTVAGERVVWHTSWWPNAYSGLLVKVPNRRLTMVLLANSDALSSPQGGAANVQLYPLANVFLRLFLPTDARARDESFAMGLVATAMTSRAAGDFAHADELLRSAVRCCTRGLAGISDDARLVLFGDSGDAAARRFGTDAARRTLDRHPTDDRTRFNLGIALGKVRPTFRINGRDAELALAEFEAVLGSGRPLPKWMEAWASYLVAEHIFERDPVRARKLAEAAKATGVDTDALQSRIAKLLQP